MLYTELKKQHEIELNDFPLGFAFSNKQFDEMMNEWGLDADKDIDKIASIGAGGFIQKKDIKAFHEMMDRHQKELKDLRKSIKVMEDAFYHEMCNHEYGINPQADYDVLSCFGHIEYHGNDWKNELSMYCDELGFNDDIKKAYLKAKKRYFKNARENDWF